MASMSLKERNEAARKIVEENHRKALNTVIDVQSRSQIIEFGALSFAFRTPCRVVISGPTLRNI